MKRGQWVNGNSMPAAGDRTYEEYNPATVLLVKQMGYVDAARVLGYSHLRIMFSEITPNVLANGIILFILNILNTIGTVSTLSFLGLGVQPPNADWGAMIAEGMGYIDVAAYLVLVPSMPLVVVFVSFSLLADELQKVLNPRYNV